MKTFYATIERIRTDTAVIEIRAHSIEQAAGLADGAAYEGKVASSGRIKVVRAFEADTRPRKTGRVLHVGEGR